jgi:channel protein (hemolysin III family)
MNVTDGSVTDGSVTDATTSDAGTSSDPAVKPTMRGVLHEVAFFVSLVTGGALVVAAPTTGSALVVAVYAVSVSLLFGVSALFHRHTWGPAGRRRMRRADHSTIFIAIAGSYTAVAGIALHGWPRTTLLVIVWAGASGGIVLRQVWLDAPKWVIALPYVVVGWAAVVVLPQLFRALGGAGWSTPSNAPIRCRRCSGTTRSSTPAPSSGRPCSSWSSPGSSSHWPGSPAGSRASGPVSRPSGAACTAGSHRGGSTRPPWACRSSAGPRTPPPARRPRPGPARSSGPPPH